MLDFSLLGQGERAKVRSVIDTGDGEQTIIQIKCIVGADGGRSKVRELAGIPFEGDRSNRHWIRIDGIVETNMPEARRGICVSNRKAMALFSGHALIMK
jgi:2-polyprenyl-6-methoxyphenol hydroxylase-like FAD-dependent oxidoreductase